MALRDIVGRILRRPPDSMQSARGHLGEQRAIDLPAHPSVGMTPAKLAMLLRGAETGNLRQQAEFADDIEEKDAHIYAELAKRKRNLLAIPWEIVPPARRPTAAEVAATDGIREMFDEIPDIEDVILNMADGVLKGYSCLELEWQRNSQREILPKQIHFRPQWWFQTPHNDFNTLTLCDGSRDGEELDPFGWIVHRHQARSGYLPRSGLVRVLAWPYLFKIYSVGDLQEFLDVYGLPIGIGRYDAQTATDGDKAKLLSALIGIGHSSRGIIPKGMEIDWHEAATGSADVFQAMIDWCEISESKAILGSTLTSQATNVGSEALGKIHYEAVWDLAVSDARQIEATLTRDLIYPLAALNFGITDRSRCPRFKLQTTWREELSSFADAIPKLTQVMNIPAKWAHTKTGIPMATEGEEVLRTLDSGIAAQMPDDKNAKQPIADLRFRTGRDIDGYRRRLATDQETAADAAVAVARDTSAAVEQRIAALRSLLTESGGNLSRFRDALTAAMADDPPAELVEALARMGIAGNLLARLRYQR